MVFDSLNGYLHAMPDGHALMNQLRELLSYLNNHGVATFLVTAQSEWMGPGMRTPVEASYLADTVVMMRLFEHAGSVKKAVSVLKKRGGAHEESISEIWFDAQGVHLGEPLRGLRGVLSGLPVDAANLLPLRAPESARADGR